MYPANTQKAIKGVMHVSTRNNPNEPARPFHHRILCNATKKKIMKNENPKGNNSGNFLNLNKVIINKPSEINNPYEV